MALDRRDVEEFRLFVVRPMLEHLGLHSAAAENLVVGTALHESRLAAWRQRVWDREARTWLAGAARGFFQIELPTHADLHRWLGVPARADLHRRVLDLAAPWPDLESQLVTNPAYAAAMCRVLYWRRPEPLPAADDLAGLAAYWKRHYNTMLGAGKAEDWLRSYRTFAAPL